MAEGAREKINYTELLEKEFGGYKTAELIIQESRQDGVSDEEIYNLLKSFY